MEETSHIVLPQWLDELIFNEMGAKYHRYNSDMVVIEWDKSDILNYLGTYFPRSYAESYCIFSNYFSKNQDFKNKENLSIFDFGCGTGGEIIGLLMVLTDRFPNLKEVEIQGLDGNKHAIILLGKIIKRCQSHVNFKLFFKPNFDKIEDIYGLSIQNSIIEQKFDIIVSFKAICEFASKQIFDKQFNEDEFYAYLNTNNPYEHIANFLVSKLNDDGILLIDDVTSPDKISKEWLPKIMDNGLKSLGCNVICKNKDYKQIFKVTHSRATNTDISKVAWRMIKK